MENITMENVKRIAQKKENGRWIDTYIDTDVTSVWRSLASDTVQKKINGCKYIVSIKRRQAYTHVEICVTYDNNVRSIYYLPAHF